MFLEQTLLTFFLDTHFSTKKKMSCDYPEASCQYHGIACCGASSTADAKAGALALSVDARAVNRSFSHRGPAMIADSNTSSGMEAVRPTALPQDKDMAPVLAPLGVRLEAGAPVPAGGNGGCSYPAGDCERNSNSASSRAAGLALQTDSRAGVKSFVH